MSGVAVPFDVLSATTDGRTDGIGRRRRLQDGSVGPRVTGAAAALPSVGYAVNVRCRLTADGRVTQRSRQEHESIRTPALPRPSSLSRSLPEYACRRGRCRTNDVTGTHHPFGPPTEADRALYAGVYYGDQCVDGFGNVNVPRRRTERD